MLNLGQVVYDLTNERVLIFGGVEMIQDKETGNCYTNCSFLTEELEELFYGEDQDTPFKYINFAAIDGDIPAGEFIATTGMNGCFFGCIDWKKVLENEEWAKSAKKTIQAAKDWPKPVKKEE